MPFGQFSEIGGKCPYAVLGCIQKLEENVHMLFWVVFRNWKKMSICCFGQFSETGGKCPYVLFDNFQKLEENVHMLS